MGNNDFKRRTRMGGSTKFGEAPSTSPPTADIPSEFDRRAFLMRSAVIGAAAVMTGTSWTPGARVCGRD
jgi:L-serine dehydratase